MALSDLLPGAVAERGGVCGRVDDVGEDDGCESSVKARIVCAEGGGELAHFSDDYFGGGIPPVLILAMMLDDAGLWNVRGKVSPVLRIVLPLTVEVFDDERRHPDGEDAARVGVSPKLDFGGSGSRS